MTHRITLQELCTLACFNNIESILSITAGFSSQCYQVNADNKCFFAKQISQNNEVIVAMLAADHDIAPQIIFHNDHWLITVFIDGENLSLKWQSSNENINDKIDISVKLMVRCHQIKQQLVELSPSKVCQSLINQEHFSTTQKHELLTLSLQIEDLITASFIPVQKHNKNLVCCHGDLNFSNVIIDKQENYWLVDYECAFSAPAEYDLAMFMAVNNIEEKQQGFVIERYQQQSLLNIDCKLLNAYQQFCYFINGLWYFNAYESSNKEEKLLTLGQQQWQGLDESNIKRIISEIPVGLVYKCF